MSLNYGYEEYICTENPQPDIATAKNNQKNDNKFQNKSTNGQWTSSLMLDVAEPLLTFEMVLTLSVFFWCWLFLLVCLFHSSLTFSLQLISGYVCGRSSSLFLVLVNVAYFNYLHGFNTVFCGN